MSYPPEASRSCHEADGRSDRSGGSGGGAGIYGSSLSNPPHGNYFPKWSTVGYFPPNPSHADPTGLNRMQPNWNKWSLGLDYLLQDSEGVAIFKSYLQYEGCANLLDFWFACQGFRSKVDPTDHHKIAQLIKAIYRTYIRGSSSKATAPLSSLLSDPHSMPHPEPIRLRTETRRMIAERISRKHSLDQTVFDPAQAEVEHFLRTTAYPAFLKSDIYVDFLQSAMGQAGLRVPGHVEPSSGFLSSGLPDCPANFLLTGKALPTLDEDKELKSEELASRTDQTISTQQGESYTHTPDFTKHCPHCSQYHSQGHQFACNPGVIGVVPSPMLFPHAFNHPPPIRSPNPNLFVPEHASSSPFNRTAPMQSQSSDRTPRFWYKEHEKETKPFRAYGSKLGYPRAHMNYMYTQWIDAIRPPHCFSPANDPRVSCQLPTRPFNPYHISYAPVSTRDSERHSLSSEARTEDTHSQADSGHDNITSRLRQCAHKSRQSDTPIASQPAYHHPQSGATTQYRSTVPSTATAIHEDTSTQLHRPSAPVEPTTSSRPHSKHHRGASKRGSRAKPVEQAEPSTQKSNLRSHNVAEKDPPAFFRLLSEKLQRVLENQLANERLDRLMTETSPNLPQSEEQSPPKPSERPPSTTTSSEPPVPGLPTSSLLQRPWADRLLAAARTQHADNAQAILEDHCSRIWAASTDRTPTSSGSGEGGPHPLLSENGLGTESPSTAFPPPAIPMHATKPLSRPSRSISTTRSPDPSSAVPTETDRFCGTNPGIQSSSHNPREQFIPTEPLPTNPPRQYSTPPVHIPQSSSGRLEPTTTVQSIYSSATNTTTTTTSIISTSTPGILAGSPTSATNSPHSLVIGYYMGDDPVPYRSVWPSTEITLGQFKQLIPKKKGTFRYFFKKCSDEFGSGVVHQEITNDHCVLPLWEGKVVAKVERFE